MWAFAVMFYFMLNMELPFSTIIINSEISPHFQFQKKRLDLIKQTTNFSYQETVEKSKKKFMNNCNKDVEDLFYRMFDPNPKKRITFS